MGGGGRKKKERRAIKKDDWEGCMGSMFELWMGVTRKNSKKKKRQKTEREKSSPLGAKENWRKTHVACQKNLWVGEKIQRGGGVKKTGKKKKEGTNAGTGRVCMISTKQTRGFLNLCGKGEKPNRRGGN